MTDFVRIPAPGPWADRALCKGRTSEFFVHGVPPHIRALCSQCPVRSQCLSYALQNDVRGVWAGTNWIDRERMRRRSTRAS